MAPPLSLLAASLGVSERTLRRAVDEGTIQAARPSPRRLTMSPREQSYVLSAWPLIGGLRALLRTERNVRMAALFGSRARGDHVESSDVDLLVALDDASVSRQLQLARRLEEAVGLPVELVTVDDARRSPAMLADAIADGRVLVDRDGEWERLSSGYPALAREAAKADVTLRDSAAAALAEMARSA